MAYDVEESAVRFANAFHVLRELVHLTAGHLALAPRFEIKALLGDHLYDDARAVSKIRRRLDELGHGPGAPGSELTARLDRANTEDTQAYLEIAYGELKPALIDGIRVHLANLEPLIDEPSLRLLTQLLHRQERHVTELPAEHRQPAFDDLGALAVTPHERRALTPLPPLDQPARDAFIEIVDVAPEPDDPLRVMHALMDAALCAAELSARNAHEHPDMPWDFHVDMARQAWDEIRHAEILDRLMATELDGHWGDHAIGFGYFRSVYRLDLADRLAHFTAATEQKATWRHPGHEAVFDYLRADEAAHARSSVRWGAHLLGGDEHAFREKVRQARERTGMPVQSV
jgi:hypothetical protein